MEQLQQSDGQLPSSPTGDPPLHPEIRSIVSLTLAHKQKTYFSGPLVHKLDRNPDGNKPHKDEGWREVWAQLSGPTLCIWDMEEVKFANQQSREVPPLYINITEAVRLPFHLYYLHGLTKLPHPQFVHVLDSITQPGTPTFSPRKYTNVIALNTAGMNLLFFSCPSPQDAISWSTAFRLSCWEKTRLEEIYTAHLFHSNLGYVRDTPSTLTRGRLEGWCRVRISGQTDWKRSWVCISAGMVTTDTRPPTDVAFVGSKSPTIQGNHPRRTSYTLPKIKRISGLFSRGKSDGLPERANISLYRAQRGKDEMKALLTLDAVTQAFAVYPDQPKLISSCTFIKLEGTYGEEDMCANMKQREGWMQLMPDPEGAQSANVEALKWLIGERAPFPKMFWVC